MAFLRVIAMDVDLRSNAIDTSHALRTSERATQFTERATQSTGIFQYAARPSTWPV